MARINTTGLTEIIQDMNLRDKELMPKVERAVKEAGNIAAKATRTEAEMHGLRDTGQMVDSIAPAKPEIHSDSVSIDVYPQGKRKKYGTRNAVVGFVQEYGRQYGNKKRAGIPFFENAADNSADEIQEHMKRVILDE